MARKPTAFRRERTPPSRRVPVQLLDAAATARLPLPAAPEAAADGILVVDVKGRLASYNERFAQMWRIPESVLQAADDQKAVQFVLEQVRDPDGFVARVQELYRQPEAESFDVIEFKDGRIFERYSQPQRATGGGITGRLWSFRDVTERRRHDALLAGQTKVLEMIAQGAPLLETLPALCELIQAQSPEVIPSILLLDPDGIHVRHGAAKDLPAAYWRAVDGQAIGEARGSCGTAMFRRENVIVEDIATDPLWKDFRALALAHGLRACWSAPIFDAQRRVLGSFACYFQKPARPEPRHLQLIQTATHLAAIAIVNQREETALREARLFGEQIIQHAGEGIAVCDAQLRYQVWNPNMERITGKSAAEVLGRKFLEVFPELHESDVAGALERALAGETVFLPDSHFVFHHTGKPGWTSSTHSPLRNADGVIIGVISTQRDVSARREAEDALREQRDVLDSFLNSLPGVAFVVNAERRLLRWNKNFERVTGRTPAELRQFEPGLVFAEKDLPAIEAGMLAVFTSGAASVEVDFRDRAGNATPHLFTGVRAFIGGAPCMVGVGIDITERKRAETALRFAQAELEARNASLTAINEVAGAIHQSLDFQTVAECAVSAMMRYGHSPAVALFVLNESAGCLEMRYARGFAPQTLTTSQRLPLEGSLTGQAVQRREVVVVEDLLINGRLEPAVREQLRLEGFRSVVSVPLLFQDRALGALNLIFKEPVAPPAVERETLLAIGQTIGLALANVEHVARIQNEIVERRQAEAALRTSEERFAKIFKASPVAICLSTLAEGRILDVNPAFLALFERERWEVVGRHSLEAGLWAKPAQRAEFLEELRQHGRIFNRENLFRKKGGAMGAALFSAEMLHLGGVECLLVLFNDISARRQAELDLQLRNEALAAINSIARSVNGSLDLPSVIRSAVEALVNYAHSPAVSLFLVNERLERLDLQCATGFFEETLRRGAHLPLRGSLSGLAATRREIVFSVEMAEDARVEPKLREALLAEGFRSALCLPLLNQDRVLGVMNLVFKQRRELSPTEQETFLAIGQTIGLALANAEQVARVQAEVEERRRTEIMLRQSEERFAKAFRTAPVGICISRLADGMMLEANDTFLTMYGFTRDEVIGHTSVETGLWADAAERARLLERLKKEGHLKLFEGRIRRRSGEIGTVLSAVEKIELKGELCLVTLQNDITERKRAEQALAGSREQLRALWARLQRTREAERTRIAREVHDVLGQLLTGLKLELAWCERRLPQIPDPELRQVFAAKVVATNQLADTMIETVQKIARELRPSVLDNFGLAAALEFETRQFQERTGVRCELALVAEPPVLEAEQATEVFRIFQEILTNVARHAQATTAHIQFAVADEQLTLQVSDNGRGVSEKELADAKSLGLLGMRERAALMGGMIQFRGSPGAGTTVTLTVPLKKGK